MEVMLSVSIVAFILVIGTRYYQSVKTSQKVNAMVSTINILVTASDQWHNSHREGSYQALNDWDDFRERGYLSPDMGAVGS